MHSLRSSSKWNSVDSLPSTPGFLLSESDLTEDEADVFSSSEGEGDSGIGKSSSTGSGSDRAPRLHFLNQHRFTTGKGVEECCLHTSMYPAMGSLGADLTPLSPRGATKGDLTFSQKCTELQRFIRPLLELLNGLKTGRYERGLSTFQQSVAMDRLQRIVGILQKPDMGEKYLHTLLQVEMMLKVWFPQVTVAPLAPSGQSHSSASLRPRWHQNQLHIPVKKRKLSWSDSDFPSAAATPLCKRLGLTRQPEQDYQTVPSPEPASPESPLLYSPEQQTPRPLHVRKDSGTWTDAQHETTSDSDSSSSYTCSGRRGKGKRQLQITPPCWCGGSQATQDRSVSSSIVAADLLQQRPPCISPPLSELQPLKCYCGSDVAKAQGECLSEQNVAECVSPCLPQACSLR